MRATLQNSSFLRARGPTEPPRFRFSRETSTVGRHFGSPRHGSERASEGSGLHKREFWSVSQGQCYTTAAAAAGPTVPPRPSACTCGSVNTRSTRGAAFPSLPAASTWDVSIAAYSMFHAKHGVDRRWPHVRQEG